MMFQTQKCVCVFDVTWLKTRVNGVHKSYATDLEIREIFIYPVKNIL